MIAMVPVSGAGLGLKRMGPSTAKPIMSTGTSTAARMNARVMAVALNSRSATKSVLGMAEFLLGDVRGVFTQIAAHHAHKDLIHRQLPKLNGPQIAVGDD